jgi:hypothetical protein
MTGIELIKEARTCIPELAVILAVGYGGIPATMPRDIAKLSKPFGQPQLTTGIPGIDARQPV